MLGKFKNNVKMKKRLALLLSAALVFESFSAGAVAAAPAKAESQTASQEKNTQKEKKTKPSLEVPENVVDVNAIMNGEEDFPVTFDDEDLSSGEEIISSEQAEGEEIIPVLVPGKADSIKEEEAKEARLAREKEETQILEWAEEKGLLNDTLPADEASEESIDPQTLISAEDFANAEQFPALTLSENSLTFEGTNGMMASRIISFTPEEDGYYTFRRTADGFSMVWLSGMFYNNEGMVYAASFYSDNENGKEKVISRLTGGVTYLLEVNEYMSSYTISVEKTMVSTTALSISGKSEASVPIDNKNDMNIISLDAVTNANWKLKLPDGIRQISFPGGAYQISGYGSEYTFFDQFNNSKIVLTGCSKTSADAKVELKKLDPVELKEGSNTVTMYPGNIGVLPRVQGQGNYAIMEGGTLLATYITPAESSIGISYSSLARSVNGGAVTTVLDVAGRIEQAGEAGKNYTLKRSNTITYTGLEKGYYEVTYTPSSDINNAMISFYSDYGISSINQPAIVVNDGKGFDARSRVMYIDNSEETLYINANCDTASAGSMVIKKASPKALKMQIEKQYMDADVYYDQVFTYTPSETGYFNVYTDNVEGATKISSIDLYKVVDGSRTLVANYYPSALYDYGYNETFELEKNVQYEFVMTCPQTGRWVYDDEDDESIWIADQDVKQGFIFAKAGRINADLSSGKIEQKNIDLYKTMSLNITVPKAGFYDLNVAGNSDSYLLTGDGIDSSRKQFVYKGMAKTLFFSTAGIYNLAISNETASVDSVSVSLASKSNTMASIQQYSRESDNQLTLDLKNPEDDTWITFEPKGDGIYIINSSAKGIDKQFFRQDEDAIVSMGCMYSGKHYKVIRLVAGQKYYVRLRPSMAISTSLAMIKAEDLSITTADSGMAKSYNGAAYIKLSAAAGKSGLYNLSARSNFKNAVLIDIGGSRKWSGNLLRRYRTTQNLDAQGKEYLVLHTKKLEKVHSITFTCQQLNVKDAEGGYFSSAVPADDTTWFKFTPSETGMYMMAAEVADFDDDVYVLNNNRLSYYYADEEDDDYDSHTYAYLGDSRYARMLQKGEEYYIRVDNYEEEEGSFVIAPCDKYTEEQKITEKEINLSVTNASVAWFRLDKGAYDISVTGIGNDQSAYAGIDNHTYIPEDGSVQVFNRYDNQICYMAVSSLKKASVASTVKIKIKKIDLSTASGILSLTDTYTAPSNGWYKLKFTFDGKSGCRFTAGGDLSDMMIYEGNDTDFSNEQVDYDEKGYDGENGHCIPYDMPAGDYTIYVPLRQGSKLSVERKSSVVLFEPDVVNAFIASGGTISYTDIRPKINRDDYDSYDDYEEAYASAWDDFEEYVESFYYGRGKYIYFDSRTFKEQYRGDRWTPNNVGWYSVYGTKTLSQSIGQGDGWKDYSNREGYPYQYLCDQNGNRIDESVTFDHLAEPKLYYAYYAPDEVGAQAVIISGERAVQTGAAISLTATLDSGLRFPVTDQRVIWSSSNPAIAAVDSTGKVTGVAAGTVNILASSGDGMATGVYPVTVTDSAIVYAAKIDVTGSSEVDCGKTLQLTAKAVTADGKDPTTPGVVFESSDASIATVDEKGLVTTKKVGKVTIKITSKDGKATVNHEINVKDVPAKSIKLSEKTITMKKGTKFTWLEVSFAPENTTDLSITWSSSNKKIATVNSKGVITAKEVGTAKITAKTSNGKKATVTVKVTLSDIKIQKLKAE
ncbi:MAG: Ig domain-containing protein, partial [Lachnospiraceae bacterium]|nr:Ig domain-containing protein [Lachnospiraceae bacterium]